MPNLAIDALLEDALAIVVQGVRKDICECSHNEGDEFQGLQEQAIHKLKKISKPFSLSTGQMKLCKAIWADPKEMKPGLLPNEISKDAMEVICEAYHIAQANPREPVGGPFFHNGKAAAFWHVVITKYHQAAVNSTTETWLKDHICCSLYHRLVIEEAVPALLWKATMQ